MADYKLPNGFIVKGIPDGTNKYTIYTRALDEGWMRPEDIGQESSDPTEGMTGMEKFRAGIGQGMTHVGRSLGNLAGLISDDDMDEALALDSSLLQTGAGLAGSITGQVAATLPMGGAVGGAAKVLTAARGASMAGRGANILGKALASPVGRGAVEGGLTGAVLAEHDDRAYMGGFGTGLGGAMGGLGKAMGYAWRNFKLPWVNLSKEAGKHMETTGGGFIPLSHSLPEGGILKQFYESVLANFPGAAKRIRGQHGNALDDFRRVAAEMTHPPTAQVYDDALQRMVPLEFAPGQPMQSIFKQLDDYWDDAFSAAKRADVDVGNFRLPATVQSTVDDMSGGMFPQLSGRVKGGQLLDLRTGLNRIMSDLDPTQPLNQSIRGQYKAVIKQIDDMMERSLPKDVWDDLAAKRPYYKNYLDLTKAAQKAGKEGFEATPAQLASTTAQRGGKAAMTGEGTALQQASQTAYKVLPDFPSRPGIYQLVAALGLGSSMVGFIAGTGVPALAVGGAYALSRVMASKGFQKAISGQHGWAVKADALAKGLRAAGYSGRQIAVILSAETRRQNNAT